jgi:hypothetical protein
MSGVTDRLSDDDLRELARLVRETHARTAERLRREDEEAQHAEAGRQAGAEQGEAGP